MERSRNSTLMSLNSQDFENLESVEELYFGERETEDNQEPNQPGAIYFKTPRKCGIFGVCCEAIPRQVNFLIDESVLTGKGANSTISYVHYFFEKHGLGEKNAQLHADNCGAQNKNSAFLWYYMWRVMSGLHVENFCNL